MAGRGRYRGKLVPPNPVYDLRHQVLPGARKSGSGDRVPTPAEQRLCRPYLDAEITLVNPDVILPVGRLAINLFYPTGLALEQVIGTQKQVDGRWVIPLPHPSGASRWHQSEPNRRLVQQALALLTEHLMFFSFSAPGGN